MFLKFTNWLQKTVNITICNISAGKMYELHNCTGQAWCFIADSYLSAANEVMCWVIITPDYTFYATQAAGTLSEFTEHYYFFCILSAVNQDPIMRATRSVVMCARCMKLGAAIFSHTQREQLLLSRKAHDCIAAIWAREFSLHCVCVCVSDRRPIPLSACHFLIS